MSSFKSSGIDGFQPFFSSRAIGILWGIMCGGWLRMLSVTEVSIRV
jgi:hypothetical protein